MRISDWSSDVCSSVLDSSSQAQPLAQVDQDRSGYAPYAPILPHDLIIGPLTALELNPAPDLIIRVQRIFQRHFEPVRHFMFVGNKGKSGRNDAQHRRNLRSEEHTSELQSLMRISYAVFCLKKKTTHIKTNG